MSIYTSASPAARDRTLAVLRIVAGLIFITAGTTKLFGYPPSPQPMPPFSLMSQLGIAGLLETIGGTAFALGLFTRPIAFILCGEMAVAYFQGHFPNGFFPTQNGGMGAVLFCFIFLYFTASGAGAWSIDSILARKS